MVGVVEGVTYDRTRLRD